MIIDLVRGYLTGGLFPLGKEHKITSKYGPRAPIIDPDTGVAASSFHYGIDLQAEEGTPLLSLFEGRVVYADYYVYGYGNMVRIASLDNSVMVDYFHMRDYTKLEFGQIVKPGDVVGYVGNTGLSTGPHLHFGLFEKEEYWKTVDPLPWLVEISEQEEEKVEVRPLSQGESIAALNAAASVHGAAINDQNGFTVVEIIAGCPVPLKPGQRAYIFVTE